MHALRPKDQDSVFPLLDFVHPGDRASVRKQGEDQALHAADLHAAPILEGNGKVLVMDDELAIARLLEKMLSRLGYAATIVSEGSQVLEAYAKAMEAGAPFAFVIMDMTIPGGMGGKETLVKLKELDAKVRAIATSGYSETSDYSASGFSSVLNKPYGIEELSRAVSTALGDQI